MSCLTLRYEPDPDDDLGRLLASVDTPAFSGRGEFWAFPRDFADFAATLEAYPLKADAPPRTRWGFNQGEGSDVVVGVEISPADQLGNLHVDVEIADHSRPLRRVRTTFNTLYPQLELFRRALMRVATGEANEAVLIGD